MTGSRARCRSGVARGEIESLSGYTPALRAALKDRGDLYGWSSSDDNNGGAADAADAAGFDGMVQAAMDRPAVGPVAGAPGSRAPTKEAIARCQIMPGQ